MPWDEEQFTWTRLPGGPRGFAPAMRLPHSTSRGRVIEHSQRITGRDLARLGEIMAAETGKTVLELVEMVARGELQLTSQRLQAAIAALPYRHARLAQVDVKATIRKEAAQLTDDELAAIAAGGREPAVEAPADPVKPAGVVH